MSKTIKYWFGGQFANQGERNAKETLQKDFEKIFYDKVDTNIVFCFSNKNTEYDCVVFRQDQVLIFEIKDYKSNSDNCIIDGKPNGLWFVEDSTGRKNPIDRQLNPFEQVKIQRSKITSLIYDLNMSVEREEISRHIKAGIILTSKMKIGSGIKDLLNSNPWFFVIFLNEFLININSVITSESYDFNTEFYRIRDYLGLTLDEDHNNLDELEKMGLRELDNLNYYTAERYFKNAVKIGRSNVYIWHYLAESQYGQEKFDEAIKSSIIANSLKENDPDILFLLGKCQVQLEKFGDAIISLSKIIDIDPEFESIGEVKDLLKKSKDRLNIQKIIETNITEVKTNTDKNNGTNEKDISAEGKIIPESPEISSQEDNKKLVTQDQDTSTDKIINPALTSGQTNIYEQSNNQKISNAIKNNLKIRIKYLLEDNYISTRVIVPYRMYSYGNYNYQYLDAYCELRNENRTFRIDKISVVELTGERFNLNDYKAGNLQFMEKFAKSGYKKRSIRVKTRKLVIITIILVILIVIFILIYFFVIRK